MAKNKSQNAGIVERTDGKMQLRGKELDHYAQQMINMFRNTELPAVVYKGQHVPRRVLSDYSMLTGA